jgi:DNA-binding IclR family transcriptional regulator
MSTKTLASATKVLDIVEALSGYAASGVSHTSLAKGTGFDAAFVTRTTQTLIDKGWARKDETNGLFYPTPRMGQIFGRVLASFDQAERSLSDMRRSFSAK